MVEVTQAINMLADYDRELIMSANSFVVQVLVFKESCKIYGSSEDEKKFNVSFLNFAPKNNCD